MAADYEVVIQPDRTLVIEIPHGPAGKDGVNGSPYVTLTARIGDLNFPVAIQQNQAAITLYAPEAFSVERLVFYCNSVSPDTSVLLRVNGQPKAGLINLVPTPYQTVSFIPTSPVEIPVGARVDIADLSYDGCTGVICTLIGTRI